MAQMNKTWYNESMILRSPMAMISPMRCSNIKNPDENDHTVDMHPVTVAVAALSIIGCSLNLYVIVRIVSQSVRRIHFSKIFFLSLAVADLLVSGCSLGYTLKILDVIAMKRNTTLWYLAIGLAWTALASSLLHVVAITADRFFMTNFALRYRTEAHKKRKVVVGSLSIWIGSILLVASMKWEHQVAFWCAAVCIPTASIGIIITYSQIIIVSIKRTITKRTGRPSEDINLVDDSPKVDDIQKSMNTLLLSLIVSGTYIVANVPLSVVLLRYLHDKSCPSGRVKVALQAFFTTNVVVDPLMYALYDIVRTCTEKIEIKSAFQSSQSSQSTSSSTQESATSC